VTATSRPLRTRRDVAALVVGFGLLVLPLLLAPGLAGAAGPGPPEYSVTFLETGLPTGTRWAISMAGTSKSSANGTIVFPDELPQSYFALVLQVPPYQPNQSTIDVHVYNRPVSYGVTFTKNTSTFPNPGDGGGGGGGPSTSSSITPLDWTLVVLVLGGMVMLVYFLYGRRPKPEPKRTRSAGEGSTGERSRKRSGRSEDDEEPRPKRSKGSRRRPSQDEAEETETDGGDAAGRA
jgi:hypothetical protein